MDSMAPHDNGDRLERERTQWISKEERLRKLFGNSPSIERAILTEKLRWHERMLLRYKNAGSLTERSMLHLIRKERNNLIKTIYPNRLLGFLYKVLHIAVLEKRLEKKLGAEEMRNRASLRDVLYRAGFKEQVQSVERHIKQGHDQFSVPVSYYLNEKERMDYCLKFGKDQNGQCRLEGFKAELHNLSGGMQKSTHNFTADEPDIFSAEKAYALLSGRAVLVKENWKLFDLNDKDSQGNYRIREFPENYGYEIEKTLDKLPLKTDSPSQTASLIKGLEEGRREEAVLVKNGNEQNIFLEADPFGRFFRIYDEKQHKTTLGALLKTKAVPIAKKEKNGIVRSGLHKEQDKGLVRKVSRRIK